jgi:hypothetical protein
LPPLAPAWEGRPPGEWRAGSGSDAGSLPVELGQGLGLDGLDPPIEADERGRQGFLAGQGIFQSFLQDLHPMVQRDESLETVVQVAKAHG